MEINSEAVVNTLHIPLIEERGLNRRFIKNYSRESVGYRLLVSEVLDHQNKPENLSHLANLANAHNCKWLVLSQSGPVVPGLNFYDTCCS